jgi:hypothetical protein
LRRWLGVTVAIVTMPRLVAELERIGGSLGILLKEHSSASGSDADFAGDHTLTEHINIASLLPRHKLLFRTVTELR